MKDPCSFLGVLAVVLFVSISLGSASFSKSLQDSEDFSLASLSKIFAKPEKTEIFLNALTKFQPESPELLFINENSLKSVTPAIAFSPQVLGALVEGYEIEDTKNTVVEYVIETGDSLWSIADKFGISLETILWANNLNKNSYIQPGQKLVILPVSGVLHHVQDGDTISAIAQQYKGKTEDIIAFNGLSGEGDIYIGDILIVPNGIKPASVIQKQQEINSIPLDDSYFIPPVLPPYIITQGLHYYNAIDFSYAGNACGRPVLAAAGGIIQKIGYDRTAGNYVRILHPNGVVTFYGHLIVAIVAVNQPVRQGETIGYIGNTGYTIGPTGCHVHFEVRGASNPFAR